MIAFIINTGESNIDEGAVNFYTKYGFIMLPDSGKMFLPMKNTIFL